MKKQLQESLVLCGQNKTKLRYNLLGERFKLYSLDKDGCEVKVYSEGIDYISDRKNGLIFRTEKSAIPDYCTHPFYGKGVFDLEDYGGKYSNNDYIVFTDYYYNEGNITTEFFAEQIAAKYNNKKIFANNPPEKNVDILVFGDSISCGCEARLKENIYYNRFADYLNIRYGVNTKLTVLSKGGYNTENIKEHFNKFVKGKRTGIALIAFGMNDQNCINGEPSVLPERYYENINYFLDNIKCDITPILISPCKPNELWNLSCRYLNLYAEQLKKISVERKIHFANVSELWQTELNSGKRSVDLLNNNVNHPTDYGHYVYFESLKALL